MHLLKKNIFPSVDSFRHTSNNADQFRRKIVLFLEHNFSLYINAQCVEIRSDLYNESKYNFSRSLVRTMWSPSLH